MSALQQFIGCYFHEDFIEDYGSPKGAVDAYLKGFSIESVQQALAELRELLARNMSEDDLGHYVWYNLHCAYHMPADGLTPSQWLWMVVEQMEDWLKKRPNA